ncbi:hypothetical protein FRC00_001621 [Tulasnella sp. 408]|nr:hypothetical protein FRC00_001621 [Tulasnella sp. 408]
MDQGVDNKSPPPVPLPTDIAAALEEILRLVLQFADKASLITAARVCRFWSHIAIGELWKVLPSIFPLLELVAPRLWVMDPTKYHQDLLSCLAKADWARFRRYSFRIRSVGVGNTVQTDLPPDSAALVQMFNGLCPLLPNIKRISWRFNQKQNCSSILPFIGPHLESLSLDMGEGIDDVTQSLLMQSLTHRMPTLKVLQLNSSGLAHRISHSFAALISSLPNLTQLLLPPFFLTEEVVAATGQLPLLTVLYSEWSINTGNYHESGMCFKFMPGTFPRLIFLYLPSLPNRMAEILQSADHVGRLRFVILDCPSYNSPQEIENILSLLGSAYDVVFKRLVVY